LRIDPRLEPLQVAVDDLVDVGELAVEKQRSVERRAWSAGVGALRARRFSLRLGLKAGQIGLLAHRAASEVVPNGTEALEPWPAKTGPARDNYTAGGGMASRRLTTLTHFVLVGCCHQAEQHEQDQTGQREHTLVASDGEHRQLLSGTGVQGTCSSICANRKTRAEVSTFCQVSLWASAGGRFGKSGGEAFQL